MKLRPWRFGLQHIFWKGSVQSIILSFRAGMLQDAALRTFICVSVSEQNTQAWMSRAGGGDSECAGGLGWRSQAQFLPRGRGCLRGDVQVDHPECVGKARGHFS